MKKCLAPCLRAMRARNASSGSGGSVASTGSTVYEGQRAVDEYLQMHFGVCDSVFPYLTAGAADGLAFPERCADHVAAAFKTTGKTPSGAAALDVGCAVGGASFALANHGFGRVDGVDFSGAFITAANSMKDEGQLAYTALVEGTRMAPRVAKLEPPPPAGTRLAFYEGDACALEPLRDAGKLRSDGYDAVLASNLLCRLPRPRAFLRSCADWLVKPGGTLVLLTPFSWLEQWTPRDEWIGGGDLVSSEELQREMTGLGFVLRARADVPFLIREHARKFQYPTARVEPAISPGRARPTCWPEGYEFASRCRYGVTECTSWERQ